MQGVQNHLDLQSNTDTKSLLGTLWRVGRPMEGLHSFRVDVRKRALNQCILGENGVSGSVLGVQGVMLRTDVDCSASCYPRAQM